MTLQAPGSGGLCELKNLSINESSGVARSYIREGVYWTHNDSGDGPNFFAFDLKGADLGTFSLKGVTAIDWEDMASAKIRGVSYLYLGDIGDNAKQRKTIIIYRVKEPTKPGTIQTFDTFICKYPDGAHNCESLIVTPQGDIQLITKTPDGICGVYTLTGAAKSGEYTLKKLGTLRIEGGDAFRRLATGADMSRDGKTVVVRTYFSILTYRAANASKWFESNPIETEPAAEIQGEAICFAPANKRYVTTSEGTPCKISFARVP